VSEQREITPIIRRDAHDIPRSWKVCFLHNRSISSDILSHHLTKERIVRADQRTVLLIVEDDQEMRSLLCDELWDLGWRIVEARDGDEALERIGDSMPHLILSDLRMPAGGLDYVARLRTLAPTVPIVLMTAFGDAQTREEAYRCGVAAFLDKPVRMADLKATIKQLVHTDGAGARS